MFAAAADDDDDDDRRQSKENWRRRKKEDKIQKRRICVLCAEAKPRRLSIESGALVLRSFFFFIKEMNHHQLTEVVDEDEAEASSLGLKR